MYSKGNKQNLQAQGSSLKLDPKWTLQHKKNVIYCITCNGSKSGHWTNRG